VGTEESGHLLNGAESGTVTAAFHSQGKRGMPWYRPDHGHHPHFIAESAPVALVEVVGLVIYIYPSCAAVQAQRCSLGLKQG
jgi:hypothetical protein